MTGVLQKYCRYTHIQLRDHVIFKDKKMSMTARDALAKLNKLRESRHQPLEQG